MMCLYQVPDARESSLEVPPRTDDILLDEVTGLVIPVPCDTSPVKPHRDSHEKEVSIGKI